MLIQLRKWWAQLFHSIEMQDRETFSYIDMPCIITMAEKTFYHYRLFSVDRTYLYGDAKEGEDGLTSRDRLSCITSTLFEWYHILNLDSAVIFK